jgi:hypothetical protein
MAANGQRSRFAGLAMQMAYLVACAGICAVASYGWAGAGISQKRAAERAMVPVASAVERSNKADRTVPADRMLRAFDVRCAGVLAFSVEISNPLNAAVTLRDRDGSILYRFSPTERMTIVATRAVQAPVFSEPQQYLRAPREIGTSAQVPRELPDGCESAFSPYVEPGMANVIGRCIS